MTIDQIVALFASFGACLSAFATFLTVRQIAKQRKASYRPELVISRVIFECGKNPLTSSPIPTNWIARDEKEKVDPQVGMFFSLPLHNIGLGAAKSVSVSWSFPFESITKQVNELAQKTLSAAYFKFENGLLSLESDDFGAIKSIWENQQRETLDYVLPAAARHEPVLIRLPSAYIQIVSSLFYFSAKKKDRDNFQEIPPLMATVEFYDIGGDKYKAIFNIQFSLVAMGGDGSFIHGYLESRKRA